MFINIQQDLTFQTLLYGNRWHFLHSKTQHIVLKKASDWDLSSPMRDFPLKTSTVVLFKWL